MQNPIRAARTRGSRRGRALPRSLFVLATVAVLAACGENEPDDMSETSMPERPESHVVTGSTEAPQAEADPTHQSSTGGAIPGYDGVNRSEQAVEGAE